MKIRAHTENEISEIAQLEQDVWQDEAASEFQIRSRLEVCPEGSVVAELPDGTIGGYASAQRINKISAGSWSALTDNGNLRATHVPGGAIAFGVSMSVPARAAQYGISGAIIEYYARIFAIEGDCSTLCLGSRLPGFGRWRRRHSGSIKDYLGQRRNGYSIDPELRLYEKAGFKLLFEVPGYFPDPLSCDYGAIVIQTRWDVETVLAPPK